MYRYNIEFAARTVDETELREFLEEYFAASTITIARRPDAAPERYETRNRFEELILKALESGKPARRKHLLGLAEAKSQRVAINATLQGLEERGVIRKPRHGVYVAAAAPDPREEDIPAMDATFPRPTQDRIMELLATPRTAVELREETGVTRQRVEQILSRLEEQGLVTRNQVSGERGQYVYIRADVPDRDILLTRQPQLSEARARVLSALPPETICWVGTVGNILSLSSPQLMIWFEQFSAQGLVTTFRLGQHRYVGLTPRGFSHPQYDAAAPKADRADLIADFGPKRTMFLQVLFVLGELRTIDVTRALPEDALDDVAYGSGQVVQRLQASRLIESVPSKRGAQSSYRLTAKGQFATATLNRLQPPPSAQALRAEMERRRQKYVERMRRIGLNSLGAGIGSPAQEAAVKVLRTHGPLTRPQISDLMEVKFKHPRSLDLALCQMEKRGLVQRARDINGAVRCGAHGAQIWESVEKPGM